MSSLKISLLLLALTSGHATYHIVLMWHTRYSGCPEPSFLSIDTESSGCSLRSIVGISTVHSTSAPRYAKQNSILVDYRFGPIATWHCIDSKHTSYIGADCSFLFEELTLYISSHHASMTWSTSQFCRSLQKHRSLILLDVLPECFKGGHCFPAVS